MTNETGPLGWMGARATRPTQAWLRPLALLGVVAASCGEPGELDAPRETTAKSAEAVYVDAPPSNTPLAPGEKLAARHFVIRFGERNSPTNTSLVERGFQSHGAFAHPNGQSMLLWSDTQQNGSYRIASKNDPTHEERISYVFPNKVPPVGGPSLYQSVFDGTALWLTHSQFHPAGVPIPNTSNVTGEPPQPGTLSAPSLPAGEVASTGTRPDWTTGPADYGTAVRVTDDLLARIPIVENRVIHQSYLIETRVYVPSHPESGRYTVRMTPYLARGEYGLTAPGGLGFDGIDFSSVLDHWNLAQVRADITTSGGTLSDQTDDWVKVKYRFYLNGVEVLAQEPEANTSISLAQSGPALFGPAFGLTRAWQGDAAEAFIDAVEMSRIEGPGILRGGESLGPVQWTETFGTRTDGAGTGLSQYGLVNRGVMGFPSRELRLFDAAGTQASGSYTIAYKRNDQNVVSHHIPNFTPGADCSGATPPADCRLPGGGIFDGTALWLGHSRFSPTHVPALNQTSYPGTGNVGTRPDGSVGQADFGSDLYSVGSKTVDIPITDGVTTLGSYLVSMDVYVPNRTADGAHAQHDVRFPPSLLRNGTHGPGRVDTVRFLSSDGDFTNKWTRLEMRVDLATYGGHPGITDDRADATYRALTDGILHGSGYISADGHVRMTSGPLRFGPGFGLAQGMYGDAPEAFVDNIKFQEILPPQVCDDTTTCPSGKVCGADNGAAFGFPAGTRVCWDATCDTIGTAQCGSIYAKCGLCTTGGACTSDSNCTPGLACIGGSCSPGDCQSDVDCADGYSCGEHNGGCFGLSRGRNVCWPTACENGPFEGSCGESNSPCGSTCACVTACDPASSTSTCPSGEVCKANVGIFFDSPSRHVCVDPRCPSNDPALCGEVTAVCGAHCVCTPNCDQATCADPRDGCGGVCPGVCAQGTCTNDLSCPAGSICLEGINGTRGCYAASCRTQELKPPLCGSPAAICGETCPACTPNCDGRECGPDPACGTSCGTCAPGTLCTTTGECVVPPTDTPITVPDGNILREIDALEPASSTGIGALVGFFSVSEVGSPQYTIPIDVPPGRAGLEPVLSLKYSGSRANGDLGIGWHLEGISKITRCPKTFALDGAAGPVSNDPSDRLCIDGKRLVAISGVYGTNGAEYRTLIDSFAKITSHVEPGIGIQIDPWPTVGLVERFAQGPDYFRVWTKDGRILLYGGTIDSTVIGRNGVRHTWYLRQIEDRARNNLIISYDNLGPRTPPEVVDGKAITLTAVRPRSIAYTGNGTTPGNREVRFAYLPRTDREVRYLQGGVGNLLTERLDKITTLVKGKPVKTYKLQYSTGNRSQIEKVFECERDGEQVCKLPTQFEYVHESGFRFEPSSIDLLTGAELDANGDGLSDYLKTVQTVDGVEVSPWLTAAKIGADIGLGYLVDGAGPEVAIPATLIWNIVKPHFWGLFADEPEVRITHDILMGTGSRSNPTATVYNIAGVPCSTARSFLDFDQDGKDDIMARCGSDWYYVARSLGDGNFERFPSNGDQVLSLSSVPSLDFATVRLWQHYGRPTVIYDIDGDALQDAVSCKDPYTIELRRRLGPGLGFSAPMELESSSRFPGFEQALCSSSRPTHNTFDVDGNGTPDLLVRDRDDWKVLRYTVDGSGPQLTWERVPFPDVNQSAYGRDLGIADLNSDGLPDVWSLKDDQGTIWVNAGGRAFVAKNLNRPRPALDFTEDYRFQRAAALDYNADGRVDIIENWTGGGFWYNVALLPNSDQTTFDWIEAVDLKWLNQVGGFLHGSFAKQGDVDGDGNRDLFGEFGGAFYGSGIRNSLLARVEDGLGRITKVSYDGAGTYTNECGGPVWPETCLRRMHGLVAEQADGYVDTDGYDIIERKHRHRYTNARVSVTGHGFLGFEKRSLVEYAANEDKTVTTEFEPPARFTLSGGTTQSTEPPYIYPLAGLPKRIVTDVGGDTQPASELEDEIWIRRTVITNTWVAGRSAYSRAFPKLQSRETAWFEWPKAPPFHPPLPVEGDGVQLSKCLEEFIFDGGGNERVYIRTCHGDPAAPVERLEITNFILGDPEKWLIANPELTTIWSRRGNIIRSQEWDFEYDENGLMETATRAPLSAAERRITTYGRDAFGNIDTITQSIAGEAPRVTSITFDADGIYPRSITNPLGHIITMGFDPRFGAKTVVVDPNNQVTRTAYDGFGLPTEERDPEGTTLYTYAPLKTSQSTAVGTVEARMAVSVERLGTLGSSGGHIVQELDYFGRPVVTRTDGFQGAEVVEEITYDAWGRVLGITSPHVEGTAVVPFQTFAYDRLGRLIRTDRSDGTVVRREYATFNSIAEEYGHWFTGIACSTSIGEQCGIYAERIIDENEKATVLIKDFRGLILRSIDEENLAKPSHLMLSSDYLYGPFDRLVELRDHGGKQTKFEYDAYGRLAQHTDPDSGETNYTYNAFDELVASRDASQVTRVYDFDDLGRIVSIGDPTGTSVWTYDQGTNAIGRISSMQSPSTPESPSGQHVAFNYEPTAPFVANRGLLDHLIYTIDGSAYDIDLNHDDLGRLSRVGYPEVSGTNPMAVTYSYTGAVLTSVQREGTPSVPLWQMTEAFEGHLLQREVFGNGVETEYAYTPHRHQLQGITTSSLSVPTIRDLDYTFYDNGLVDTRLDTKNGTTAQRQHFYDELNRIQAIVEISGPGAINNAGFEYDDYSNLIYHDGIAISFLPDKPHLVDLAGGSQYIYDAVGNVQERNGPTVPGGKQTFEYTWFDLPRRIITGAAPNEETTLFEYSADGERIVQRNAEADLHFVAGLYQRKLTPTGWGNEERFRIVAGGRVIGEVVRVDGIEETRYFHTDRLGSVETITDGTGAMVHQSFDAFGGTGAAPEPTRFGFTGHEHDRDLGLIDMQGRVYDQLAGRFLSPDPIMQAPFFSQGLNRYAYAFNDPINNIDPSGLMSTDENGQIAHGWAMSMPFLQIAGQAIGLSFLSPSAAVNVGVSLWTGAYGGSVPDQGPTTIQTPGAPAPTSNGAGLGTTHAVAQNKGRVGPDGGDDPLGLSLFAPGRGALACGGGGDVCLEILRRQQAEIVRQNIEAVSEGEWALFWAYSGGQAVSFVRWLWAARAAGAAARAAPTIGRTLNETVGNSAANVVRDVLKGRQPLSALSAEQRAAAAAFYRDVATRTVGREAAAASRYNVARAEFLEGTRSQLSPTLPEFIKNGF